MPTYKAPVEEALFLLNDVFRINRYDNLPGFADASPDVVAAILAEAAKLAEEVLAPVNRTGDIEGCTRHADGSVTTPKGFKEAYRQYADGGWMGISAPAEFGGQGLPETLTVTVNEFMAAANMAFAMYPGLTQGAIAALHRPRHARAEGDLSAAHDRRQMDRHHEPDRAALRHRPRALAHQGGAGQATAATGSPAPRSSSPPASTTLRTTSCISCSPASRARRPAPRAPRCSWCRNSCPATTARSARAMASPAARSKRRWASMATPPACSTSRTPRAG